MRILLVEDDYLQADWICDELRREFRALGEVQIDRISTEFEFRNRIKEIAASAPDILIMDVMIRWTDPSPELKEPPEEVKAEGPWRAGLRCQKLLTAQAPTIPILFYTVLQERDLANELPQFTGQVAHLSKESDPKMFHQKVRELALNCKRHL